MNENDKETEIIDGYDKIEADEDDDDDWDEFEKMTMMIGTIIGTLAKCIPDGII